MGSVSKTRLRRDVTPPEFAAEHSFYSHYEWCLNPAPTLAEQRLRCAEEVRRWETLPDGWQRDECAINIYLFACAIASTVQDALAGPALKVKPLVKRVPRLGRVAAAARRADETLNWFDNIVGNGAVRRWCRRWSAVVDEAAELLCSGAPLDVSNARTRLREALPDWIERRRMRIPEPFRCQDMSHHDVLMMVRRFIQNDAASGRPRPRRMLVLGPRTSGAYFAPLVAATLRAAGYDARWFSVRPKERLSWWERQSLRAAARDGSRILIVDDHPNTGHTITLLQKLMQRFGIAPERVEVLLPLHWRRADFRMPAAIPRAGEIRVHLFQPGEQYKLTALQPEQVEPLLRQYFVERGWEDASILPDDASTAALNAELHAHLSERFEARLKRLYRVRLRDGAHVETRRVLAKSVGWGWFGYHAWIAGRRLAGFVPEILGLRNGLLFMEWQEGPPLAEPHDARWAEAAGRYIAARAGRLRLAEDPAFFVPLSRWVGWHEALAALKQRYGMAAGWLLAPLLRRRLRRFVSPVPALTDGRMQRGEWVLGPAGPVKVDFEQHNFGGAEFDNVDPAWDLACAIAEFGHEEEMLRAYLSEVDDPGVRERLKLWRTTRR